MTIELENINNRAVYHHYTTSPAATVTAMSIGTETNQYKPKIVVTFHIFAKG